MAAASTRPLWWENIPGLFLRNQWPSITRTYRDSKDLTRTHTQTPNATISHTRRKPRAQARGDVLDADLHSHWHKQPLTGLACHDALSLVTCAQVLMCLRCLVALLSHQTSLCRAFVVWSDSRAWTSSSAPRVRKTKGPTVVSPVGKEGKGPHTMLNLCHGSWESCPDGDLPERW